MILSPSDKEKLQIFFTNHPVKKAYLFGSHARSEARTDSDVDILVELDYSHPIGLTFVQMVIDLETLLRTKVDLVTTDALSEHIRPFVDQDKQLIYERAA